MASAEPVIAALRDMINKELIELQGIREQIEALRTQQRELQRENEALAKQLAAAPAIIAEAKRAAKFIASLPGPDCSGRSVKSEQQPALRSLLP